MSSRLDSVYISDSELDLHSRPEAGWYIVDSHHHLIDGPFATREGCFEAIKAVQPELKL